MQVVTLVLLLAGVLCAGVFALAPWVPASVQLPVGEMGGLAVTKDGRLYCAVTYYSRIQVYDSDGRFLNAWYVRSGRGDIRIRMNAEELEVATARGRMFYVFNLDGDLLSEETAADEKWEQLYGIPVGQEPRDGSGNTYAIRGYQQCSRVVKTAPDGHSTTIIGSGPLGLLMGPIGTFFYWGLGVALLIVARTTLRR